MPSISYQNSSPLACLVYGGFCLTPANRAIRTIRSCTRCPKSNWIGITIVLHNTNWYILFCATSLYTYIIACISVLYIIYRKWIHGASATLYNIVCFNSTTYYILHATLYYTIIWPSRQRWHYFQYDSIRHIRYQFYVRFRFCPITHLLMHLIQKFS